MTDITVESGVAFAGETDAEVFVEATFLQSGNQLQNVFIGLEPVILVVPEYDAEANEVKFVLTVVDLDAQGLVSILDVLLDAAKEMAEQQGEDVEFDDYAKEDSAD